MKFKKTVLVAIVYSTLITSAFATIEHSNIFELYNKTNNHKEIAYEYDGTYEITPGQPFSGASTTSNNEYMRLTVRAGRKHSTEVINKLRDIYGGSTAGLHIVIAYYEKSFLPDEANFFVGGILRFNGVPAAEKVYIGQFSKNDRNIWFASSWSIYHDFFKKSFSIVMMNGFTYDFVSREDVVNEFELHSSKDILHNLEIINKGHAEFSIPFQEGVNKGSDFMIGIDHADMKDCQISVGTTDRSLGDTRTIYNAHIYGNGIRFSCKPGLGGSADIYASTRVGEHDVYTTKQHVEVKPTRIEGMRLSKQVASDYKGADIVIKPYQNFKYGETPLTISFSDVYTVTSEGRKEGMKGCHFAYWNGSRDEQGTPILLGRSDGDTSIITYATTNGNCDDVFRVYCEKGIEMFGNVTVKAIRDNDVSTPIAYIGKIYI